MFKLIVAAADGSACAAHALDLALALAKAGGGHVAVCAVAEPIPAAGAVPRTAMEEAMAEAHGQAQRVVNAAVAKATESGVSADGGVFVGDPSYEIVEYANKIGADAIVLGTHGRSGLKRLFMGSVAEGVLRSASVPVLTVREEARIPPLNGSSAR